MGGKGGAAHHAGISPRRSGWLAFLLIAGLALGLRAESEPDATDKEGLWRELQQVQQRLSELAQQVSGHDPDWWRARREAEYSTPELDNLRQERRRVEKELYEKRAAFQQRLAAVREDYRDLLRQQDAAYARWAERERECEAIQNELYLAQRKEPPDEQEIARLEAELNRARQDAQSAREEAEALRTTLTQRLSEWARSDERCAALYEEIMALETSAARLRAEMGRVVDSLPEAAEAEAARRQVLEEIARLKQREAELRSALGIN